MAKSTKKKPVIGRPKLSDQEARTEKLEIRLNQAESTAIEKAAKRSTGKDRKTSEWARGVLLSEAEQIALQKAD